MAGRAVRGGGGGHGTPPPVQGTTSGYGPTRADSAGFSPRNPYAFQATQAAKAYTPSGGATVDSILKAAKGG